MKPVLQALVLADHVYQDKSTGKMVIAGAFHQIHIRKRADSTTTEPTSPPGAQPIAALVQAGSPYAYVSLTELKGEHRFTLRYVDLRDNKPLLQTEFTVSCNDPLEPIQLGLQLPMLPTPHPGFYALELLCLDEPMGALRVVVMETNVAEE